MGERIELVRLRKRVNFTLLFTALIIAFYGALIINSISSAAGQDSIFFRQILWIGIGLFLLIGFALLNYVQLKDYGLFIYITNLFLLILVVFGGSSSRGAQRWIDLSFFRFTPSEFCKIAIILTLAAFLSTRSKDLPQSKQMILSVAHVVPSIALIFLQPDLGTALVLGVVLLGMLLTAGIKFRHLLALLTLVVLLFGAALNFHVLKDYQIKRLVVFINPEVDPLGSGYSLNQSKIAIGSGGVLGKGLTSGTQTNLQFIPEAHTDFIFSVLGEKLGFVGGVLLLGLYFLLISRGLQVALTAGDLFGSLAAVGIVSMWLFQILVNVGMTMGIMPVTGIPLPFMSYGGSAMLINMASVGLLQSIYSRRL